MTQSLSAVSQILFSSGAVLLFLVTAIAFAKAPVPPKASEHTYYATTKGSKWVYVEDVAKSAEPAREWIFVVTKVEQGKGGAKLLSIGTETKGKIEPYSRILVAADGIFEVANQQAEYP